MTERQQTLRAIDPWDKTKKFGDDNANDNQPSSLHVSKIGNDWSISAIRWGLVVLLIIACTIVALAFWIPDILWSGLKRLMLALNR